MDTARRLKSVCERLARFGGNSSAPHPGRNRKLLADGTPEQSTADRRTIEKWERANGTPDIKGAADEARAKLLMWR